ncbi:type II toxin-antitoxin system PemK/MazF family toxin [Candidatus Uhrbacteria bacterium]|nr:type II toxin-antitoxin system PemK/MazF family toxin [Candidatus Uhrbacteria bacterium]
MSKGVIVLVPFPFTDLSGNKVRPCLVLYEQKNGEDCIVSFISSVKRPKLGTNEIRLKATTANGLKADSVIKMDKIATLQKKIVLGELGRLEPALMKDVDSRLKKIFGLK